MGLLSIQGQELEDDFITTGGHDGIVACIPDFAGGFIALPPCPPPLVDAVVEFLQMADERDLRIQKIRRFVDFQADVGVDDMEVDLRRTAMQLLRVASVSAGEDHACVRFASADEFDGLHEAAELWIVVGFVCGNRDVADGERAFGAFEIAAVVVGHGIGRVWIEIGDDRLFLAVHRLGETLRVMVVMVVGDGYEIKIRDKLLRAAVVEIDGEAMLRRLDNVTHIIDVP